MPSRTFAIGSVIFGIVWGIFFYPPAPKHKKDTATVQQMAQAR